MSVMRVAALWCAVCASCAAGTAVAQADDKEPIARARALLELLAGEQYEEFVAGGDETMKTKFSAAQARQLWASLVFQHGEYEAEESAELTRVREYDSVRFTLRFARARQQLRIVLDQRGRLSGLWLDRVEPRAVYAPPDYVRQDSFREVETTVSAGEFPLGATLTIPVGPGPYPGVVLVHGSGPHDRDETVAAHKPFRDLAWGLASRGIVVLRYEKRTKAHPQAKKADEWTLADATIDDAVAAVELLRKRAEVDARRVCVVGHSLGGVAAPYIAQRADKLAGIVIMAGSARSILDVVVDQVKYLAEHDGTVSPEEQEGIDTTNKAVAAIKAGRLEDVPPQWKTTARFFRELYELDPPAAAAELRLPILVLQGSRDYQVTAADLALWKKHLDGRQNVTIKQYAELNHLFSAGVGPSGPEEYQQPGHVDVRVIETIAAWIAARGT